MGDAVVVEHGDALLVDAVGDLGNGEAGRADLVAGELEGALQGLRGGTEVQDVADRLDLSLQTLSLGRVAGLEGTPEVDDDVGDQVRGTRDGARGAHGVGSGDLAVGADEDVDVVALGSVDVALKVVHVAGAVLDALDVVHLGELGHDLGGDVLAGALGDVVEHDGDVHALGDHGEVVLELVVADAHEVRVDDREGVGADGLGALGHLDGVLGGAGAGAHVHGHATGDLLDDELRELNLLVGGAHEELAVGAKGKDAVGAGGDDLLDELLAGLVVDGLRVVTVERGDDGDDDALELRHAVSCLNWG